MAGEHKIRPYSLLPFDCDMVSKEEILHSAALPSE
jgi:hypothetical protein